MRPETKSAFQKSSVRQNVIIDSSAIVALLDPREEHHRWARKATAELPPPWVTCEAVIVEAFYLLEELERDRLVRLLKDGRVQISYNLKEDLNKVLDLMSKYATVPISLADACLVRMTELLPDPLLVTTDADFKIYRRQGRRVVPCRMP